VRTVDHDMDADLLFGVPVWPGRYWIGLERHCRTFRAVKGRDEQKRVGNGRNFKVRESAESLRKDQTLRNLPMVLLH
jgi:hypothetical protein